jgi:ComF family protein
VLADAWRLILEGLFPSRCIGCDRRGTALCGPCRADLPYLPEHVCHRCAARRTARGVCYGCRRLSPALVTIRAAFTYEGAARSAVLRLKSRSGRYLVPLMGEFLRQTLAQRPLHADLVVPVPLAPGRLKRRGFNQAALLADQVAASVHGTVATAVLARKDRPAQQTLRAADRLVNLQGAFACAEPSKIVGRRILLIDDVVTTGATLSACADTLAGAGAIRVCALAFARHL